MFRSSSKTVLTTSIAAFAALALSVSLQAQSARPGSSGRTTGSSAGSGNSNSGANSGRTTGTSSSTGGPRQYRSHTELGDATISIDPETRSLVIVTDEETHNELLKVIRTLDKPKPQVLIKVVFLEVTYNKGSDIGVEGSYTFNLKNPAQATTGTTTSVTDVTATDSSGTKTQTTNTANNTVNTLASLGRSATAQSLFGLAGATDGSFIRLASDDWSATLRALDSKGKVEILSRPSIMARNNQEAVIVVGQEVPFITNSRITDTGQTINTVQYDNVGIILKVTPFITSDGTVEMIVAPEISTLTDKTVPISNNASSPIIAKRSAETVVVTPNAKTVVIGGLMETQKIESVQKIPILGDIPILGFPFRRTVKSDVKKELMIFLTPYIINDAAGLEKITKGELNNTKLVKKAFNEQDFEKYFDNASLFPEPIEPAMPVRKATAVKAAAVKAAVGKR